MSLGDGFNLHLSACRPWLRPNQGEGHGIVSIPSADEGSEATAEDDKEPRVGLPVEKEEEGVPAEPGGPAQGGPAGERASAEGEPGAEAETGGQRGETAHPEGLVPASADRNLELKPAFKSNPSWIWEVYMSPV